MPDEYTARKTLNKINFFEGIPSPAAAGLVLMPIILNLSGFYNIENNIILSSIFIFLTSCLMISSIPTYSLKKISIPRNLTIFLLLGLGIYVSFLIFYTFKILFITGVVYIALIPISYIHFKHKNKTSISSNRKDEVEDVL